MIDEDDLNEIFLISLMFLDKNILLKTIYINI